LWIHIEARITMNNGNGKPLVAEYELVPDLREEGGIGAILRREVLLNATDAWYDPASVKLVYEISFPRYFYKPMRIRDEIRADIVAMEKEKEGLLKSIFVETEMV
jgi:type I restriction enzyme M protein